MARPPKNPNASMPRQRSGVGPRPSRSERLDARLTSKQKEIIAAAAELHGQSLTQFVIHAAVRRARRVLRDEELVRLTDKDRAALVSALMAPPEPAETLKDAWQDYRAGKQV